MITFQNFWKRINNKDLEILEPYIMPGTIYIFFFCLTKYFESSEKSYLIECFWILCNDLIFWILEPYCIRFWSVLSIERKKKQEKNPGNHKRKANTFQKYDSKDDLKIRNPGKRSGQEIVNYLKIDNITFTQLNNNNNDDYNKASLKTAITTLRRSW